MRRSLTFPDHSFEDAARGRGHRLIAGTDEAGRGPLAGPVVAAAVILDPARLPEGLNDSKVLSAGRRAALAAAILEMAQVGIGMASVEEIDALNILRASHLAMCRAIAALTVQPCHVLVDGPHLPRDLTLSCEAIVGGDGRSLSIAAASIMAKTRRDALMVTLAQQHPGYGWETNMGYPSKSHRLALREKGVTAHHRRSFRPVHQMLYQD